MGRGRRRAAVTAALALVAALALLVPAATAVGEHRGTRAAADAATSSPARREKHEHPPGTFQNSIVEAAHAAAERTGRSPREPEPAHRLPGREVIGGISEPTSVAFAPDGTAFVALKTGVIKSFDYNSAPAPTSRRQATNFADLSTPGEQLLRPRPDRHRRRPAVRRPPATTTSTSTTPTTGTRGTARRRRAEVGRPGAGVRRVPGARRSRRPPAITGCVVHGPGLPAHRGASPATAG